MSLNYFSFVQRFAELTGTMKADVNPTIIVPGAIEYAEQRIYRELDLLYTQTTDATKQVSSGVREFTISTSIGTFITVDQINIITPSATPSSAGVRVPLTVVAPEFLDITYPSGTVVTGVPEYYAMRSNSLALLGPVPDGAYFAETIGIQRPAALSSGNSSTILTQYIPDVFVAASMVYASEYIKDMRLQPSPPTQAKDQPWEQHYQTLVKSAAVEQFRAKHESAGWTSIQPSPLAQRK